MTANVRFGARGAVARRKGITNLKVITPQNFYCQPPLRQAAASLYASGRDRGRESRENLSVCDNGQHGKTCEAVRAGINLEVVPDTN